MVEVVAWVVVDVDVATLVVVGTDAVGFIGADVAKLTSEKS